MLQQIEVERDRANGAKMPRFAPGMNGYAHFAQREVPFAAFQRDVVRRLWLQCYYGKDFEGAAMVRAQLLCHSLFIELLNRNRRDSILHKLVGSFKYRFILCCSAAGPQRAVGDRPSDPDRRHGRSPDAALRRQPGRRQPQEARARYNCLLFK